MVTTHGGKLEGIHEIRFHFVGILIFKWSFCLFLLFDFFVHFIHSFNYFYKKTFPHLAIEPS